MTTAKTSLKPCVEDLFSKNTDYKFPDQAINQAESLKSLSSDLYTDSVRFIYELIQNADDAEAKNVAISVLGSIYLIIGHDGKPFNEKDLQGLCGVNNGTKRKDLEKTGYKGLGFKAVFGKSNFVLIYSNREWFRFDSSYKIKWNKQWGTDNQETWEKENDRQFIYPWQINPIWTTEREVPNVVKDYMTLRQQQFQVVNVILLNNVEEIRPAIDQLKQQPYMFLFLRNISEITFFTQSTDTLSIARDLNYGLKKVYFNRKIVSQWLIKRLELNVPQDVRDKLAKDSKAPEKLRFIKTAEVFFAAKYEDPLLDENKKIIHGGIRKLHEDESVLFSYLPTKILEYKFPVLINANFLTNANREQIHTDSAWNQWLFDQIPGGLFQWIKEFVVDERFRFQAYRLIPSKLHLTNNSLSKRFNAAFDLAVKYCNFILNRRHQLLRVDEVIIDSTSLSEQPSFIDIRAMRQYVIDIDKRADFPYAEHPFIDYDSNLIRLGVRVFNWQNCIEMFKSDQFAQSHSVEQNKRMIEYFYSERSKLETANEMGALIQQIPFLMDQNKRLKMIKDIYLPAETIGDSGGTDCNESFVNKKIFDWLSEYRQREIKQWLQKLGVTERTDLTFLLKTIIPNAATYITSENAIGTIKMLFKLFQNNSIGKKELNQLKQLKLLTTRGTLVPAEECFFSEKFKPRLPLEEHLKAKEDKFLSSSYLTSGMFRQEADDICEWQRFFIMIGVQEELRLIRFEEKLTTSEAIKHGFCPQYVSRWSPNGCRMADAYCGLKTITFLQYTKGNYEFAKLFWSFVLKNIQPIQLSQSTRVFWRSTHGTPIDADYIQWFVKHIECIPTTLNTCNASKNMFIDISEIKELCGTYMPIVAIPLTNQMTEWHSFFGFKTKLLLKDYFDLLNKICDDEKNLTNNQDRIQKIYAHMLRDIGSWSSEEKLLVQMRSKTLILLTENNQWKLASELFVYVEGGGENSSLNDAIPCIKLDFKNKTHPQLHHLLELMSVKQIGMNDLILADKGSSHAEEFRAKLIQISPYIKKWLNKLKFPFEAVMALDKTIQQDLDFIESDSLELFYNGTFVQETNVYFDITQQQLYVCRPWNSETTLMHLPNKLCRLLNIQGFEDQIRFLLKAPIKEITKFFQKNSIEMPKNQDTIVLEQLPRSEIKKQSTSFSSLVQLSNASTCIEDNETSSEESSDDSEDMLNQVRDPQNRGYMDGVGGAEASMKREQTNSSHRRRRRPYGNRHSTGTRSSLQSSSQQMATSWYKTIRSQSPFSIESDDDDEFDQIELVDVSSLSASILIPIKTPFARIGGHGGLDLHTGSIGEQLVYKHLQLKYRDRLNSMTIKWENKNGESHLPYDISLTENGKTHYIEVKSTRTNDQHSFQLSINQIEAILKYRENYFIYRIYLEQKKMAILDNIRWRLKHKQQLACFLTMKPLSLADSIISDV